MSVIRHLAFDISSLCTSRRRLQNPSVRIPVSFRLMCSEYDVRMPEIAQTADQALAVLLKLGEEGPKRPADIARELDLNRTVVHRLLATLHARGFVAQTEGHYVVGAAVVRLAEQVQPDLRMAAAPTMAQLARELSETVVMHVVDGRDAVVIQQYVATEHVLRVEHTIGSRHELWRGASGRALLSFMPDKAIERVLRNADERDQVTAQLADVKSSGYALSHDELQHGVHGLAVPVFDHNSNVVASLAIIVPAGRAQELDGQESNLERASKQISESLRRGLVHQHA